jgi:hypothetical protein
MGFVRRVITTALDLANLAKHNANFADIETDLTEHNTRLGDVEAEVVAQDVRIDNLIVNGDSGPEAADARVSGPSGVTYDVLKDRLDAEQAEVLAQLAETANVLALNRKSPAIKRKAFITVMDDDGNVAYFNNGHYDVLLSHPNAKMSLALNPIQFGAGNANYFTDAQLNTLKANPQIEIVNHGWYGEPLDYTEAELQTNYDLEKSKMIEYDLGNYDYYVYSGYSPPASVNNGALKDRLRKLYKCCLMNVGSADNYIPFESMEVKRINAYGGASTKAYIDWCVENGAWCVIFGHAWMSGQSNPAVLDDILTYIDGKVTDGLLEYATVKEMVDNYSNIIEVGNGVPGADKFILGRNGDVNFTVQGENINEVVKKVPAYLPSVFSNSALTDYPINSTTIEYIDYTNAVKYGLPDAGIVITTRYKNTGITIDAFHEQRYVQSAYGNVWTRSWRTQKDVDCWYPFLPISPSSVTTATRPRYANVGLSVFDSTLIKPIWCKTRGCTANKETARSTAYNSGDIVNNAGFFYMAVIGGITGASEPAWLQDNAFVDGTVTWVYISTAAVWVDANGATV